MPRNVRNFWVEADTDGRAPIATGPQASHGGVTVRIKNRKDGAVDPDETEVRCFARDGMLHIMVYSAGVLVMQRTVPRLR